MKSNRNVSFAWIAAVAASLLLCSAPPARAQRDGQIKALTAADFKVTRYPIKPGLGTRDVEPVPDGTVWFVGQFGGVVGHLDPKTGEYKLWPLGPGSSPHGLDLGPDGNIWVLDGGQNKVIRVNPADHSMTAFPMPPGTPDVLLNTGVFDHEGNLWFTGENGFYGRLELKTGKVQVWHAPLGYGPYGITITPKGIVWFTSFSNHYIGAIDPKTFKVTVVNLPDNNPVGSRRIYSDSQGCLWMATWGTGEILRYDPRDKSWARYKLPGLGPRGYSIFVDEKDIVWVSDFMANCIIRFDPADESFVIFPENKPLAQLLQMGGRPGQMWGGEQGADQLVVIERK